MQHLDQAMLTQLQELLGPRFAELVQRFEEDGSRRLRLLEGAVADYDFNTVFAEAHGLKGSSRNMGAVPLSELCADLEDAARHADSEAVAALTAACKSEFLAVCQYLRAKLLVIS